MSEFIDLLEQYGPALLTLLIGYLGGNNTKIKNELRLAELKLKLKENHEKIDKDNDGVSAVDGVNKIAGPE